ncbi:MAG: sugar transferase, partial [Balneolaceae bacterium]|nr:sugar transferase [Balneolaceae bacterium]
MSETTLFKEYPTGLLQSNRVDLDVKVHEYLVGLLGEEQSSRFIWEFNKSESDLPEIPKAATGLVNLQRINDIPRINRYLEAVNRSFENGQYIVIAMETMSSRKKRVLNKYPKFLSRPYYLLDFFLKRVFPKWKPTRTLYFKITNGRNRVISLTEGLARLVCCGFKIVDFKRVEYHTYIVARKVQEPAYDPQPSYGALIRLNRIGKDGKMFKVFKVRTMYPYSEYLQDYIFEKYDLSEGGKFRNDFRMTGWGRFFRKYWIDELPMFINWFKGELKLVGVRPLSRQYYELYPRDLQEMRIKIKP